MSKEKNFFSAVVYVYNAEHQISALLSGLSSFLEERFEHFEIICVNDHSTDGSLSVIRDGAWRKGSGSAALSIVNLSSYHGLEIAMSAGVDLAIGDYVLEIDSAALDYDVTEIEKVYRKVLEGYDIVSASPDTRQRLSSSLFYRLFRKFSSNHIQLHTESFRVISRRAINRVSSMSKIIPYRKVLYASSGLKTLSLRYHSRSAALAKSDPRVAAFRKELAVDTLLIFTDAGYVCARTMTLSLMALSILMAVYTIAVYLGSNPVSGWTTTLLFLSAISCGFFAILTVIIKYLQIILNLSFRRARYSFESIEKISF